MKHAPDDWRQLLPESHGWLSAVSVTPAAGVVDGAHHVALTDADEPKLDAPKLGDDLRRQVEEAAASLGWQPAAGPVHLSVAGKGFTLVPKSKIQTSPEQIARQAGLDAARVLTGFKVAHLALCESAKLPLLETLDGLAGGFYNMGFMKGGYKADTSKLPAKISLAGGDFGEQAVKECVELCKAAQLTRFVQDAPPNYLTPEKFAEIAQDVAKDSGIKCKVLDVPEMEKLGMGSMLSVGLSGKNDPRTIILEIEGRDTSRSVALVGKGLTFDSGGISIKPAAGMDEMKYDMSGGAAVLGSAAYLAKVKPPVNVYCLIGAAENMPSSKATRPGDIVKAMNGKTIEVLNTDAEGRLVLADVIYYAASQYKPELIVDIATLTGAVLHGLGCIGAGVMANDQKVADRVIAASKTRGEPMWQLPLWPELEQEAKSKVADLKNIAKPNVRAGTIMGAVFLREFTDGRDWAHLDIAGTGWNCLTTGYPQAGGSAFGMRTLIATCFGM